MISLEQFIKEEFDSDNLIWKVNIYFRNNKNLKNGFIELAAKVKNGSKLTIDDIEDYEIKYKCKAIEFINFIYDYKVKIVIRSHNVRNNRKFGKFI